MWSYRRRIAVGLLAMPFVVIGCSPAADTAERAPVPTGSETTTAGEPPTQSRETPTVRADPPREPTPTGPLPLLPNLRSLPPEDIFIGFPGEGGRELRFAGILANDGIGPIVMRPDEAPECPEGQRHASQLIYLDGNGDNRYDRRRDTETEIRPAGCLLFHPDHDHWHLDASARYTLIRPGARTPVVEQDKVSFCLRDSERLPGAEWADVPDHFGDCERDRIQGISTGWTDVYESDLDGQALALPDDLPDAVYCLRVSADPLDLLREMDESDNASAVAVRIAGDEATPVAGPACDTG